MAHGLFQFPHPVNEVSARLVAGGVVVLCLCAILFDVPWLTTLIAYGFVARVLAGPRLSPLALLVVHFITPRLRLPPKLVAGPPKRFAQGVGAVFSVTAAILVLVVDLRSYGYALLGVLVGAATLESVFAICLGCWIFGVLMRLGIIPRSVCEACDNLGSQQRRRSPMVVPPGL